ncbi:hypothetical protein D3C87_1156550 [compost metagenome]
MRCEADNGSISRIILVHSSANSFGMVLSFCNPHMTTDGLFLRSLIHSLNKILKFSLNSGVSYQICAENWLQNKIPFSSNSF